MIRSWEDVRRRAGYRYIEKWGKSAAITSGQSGDVVSHVASNAALAYPAHAGVQMYAKSANAADTDLECVFVGQDASGTEVLAYATLDGTDATTEVSLKNAAGVAMTMRRIYRGFFPSATAVPSGAISVGPTGFASTYLQIPVSADGIDGNQTFAAQFTTPVDSRAYVSRIWASLLPGGGANAEVKVQLMSRNGGQTTPVIWTPKYPLFLDEAGAQQDAHNFGVPFPSPGGFAELTDLKLRLTTATAGATIYGGFTVEWYYEQQ